MAYVLHVDDNGYPIPVLGFEPRGTQRVAATSASSARVAKPLPVGCRFVTVVATSFCRFELGDATVTADKDASAILFPGQYLDVAVRPGQRYVAFIASAEACDGYVIVRS